MQQFKKQTSKPCHVDIHWIALAEYSQMSTHVLGFQSFSGCLHHFVLAYLLATNCISSDNMECAGNGNVIGKESHYKELLDALIADRL